MSGTEKQISITPHPGRVRVTIGGAVVAETARAIALAEEGYPRAPLHSPPGRRHGGLHALQDRHPMPLEGGS